MIKLPSIIVSKYLYICVYFIISISIHINLSCFFFNLIINSKDEYFIKMIVNKFEYLNLILRSQYKYVKCYKKKYE